MKLIFVLFPGLFLFLTGFMVGGYKMAHKYCQRLNECRLENSKNQYWVRVYDMWMMTKQSSKSIENYLLENGIKSVAIYGALFLGTRLYYELKDSSVNVKYIFDKNPCIGMVGVEVKNPDSFNYAEVDAVIVTALFTYDEIEKTLKSKGYKRVIAFDEILYDMLQE